jgi:putative membrane protein
VSGNGVGDLAAEPLHGRVVEIEWGACGHGGRSMTESLCAVNWTAAPADNPSAFCHLQFAPVWLSYHARWYDVAALSGVSLSYKSRGKAIMVRSEALALILLGAIALILSGINPADRTTWWLEVFPIFIAVPILLATARRFPLTPLAYRLIFVHALILMLGGHYTYAKVPLGFWMEAWFGFARNHYDRIGHFAQGFVPAIIAREILLRRSPLTPGKWLFTIVTALCLAISACYEFVEWFAAVMGGSSADAFLGTQGDVWDTQWDMFMAFIGAMTAQILLARVQDKQLARL